MKIKCSKCKRHLSTKEFSNCSKNKIQRYCKKCKSEYAKKNRERINFLARQKYNVLKIRHIKKYIAMNNLQAKRIKFRRTNIYHSLLDVGFCFICGTHNDLCVHHKDENPNNNSIDNLQVLCRRHHSLIHRS
jgi:NAD-dependent SIR2 family protein deacetylase